MLYFNQFIYYSHHVQKQFEYIAVFSRMHSHFVRIQLLWLSKTTNIFHVLNFTNSCFIFAVEKRVLIYYAYVLRWYKMSLGYKNNIHAYQKGLFLYIKKKNEHLSSAKAFRLKLIGKHTFKIHSFSTHRHWLHKYVPHAKHRHILNKHFKRRNSFIHSLFCS